MSTRHEAMFTTGESAVAAALATPPSLATRAAISAAAQNMSRLKNVPLTAEELPKFVDLLIAEMGIAHILFASIDPTLVDARSRIINRQLDILATARLLELVAVIEGKQSIHDPVVQTVAGEIMSYFEKTANMADIHWSTPFEMIEQHYAGKLRGPTIVTREDGATVTRWWKGFDLHREPTEGPACIIERGSYRREEYWMDGKRHRSPQHGPAIMLTDLLETGELRREEAWWFEDQRHRPHEDGPALLTTHYGDNHNLRGEEYFEHGKEHRPANIGPAVTHWDQSGRKVMERFMEFGEPHRDPNSGPALFMIRDPVTFTGAEDNVTVVRYCLRGETHRDEADGPAVAVRDNGSGTLLQEQYDWHGMGHRKSGPAVIERNSAGQVIFEAWCDGSGWFSRDPSEGPAVITHDPETGTTTEEYMFEGQVPTGTSPPAMIKRDRHGNVIEQSTWDGERHCSLSVQADMEDVSDG